MRFDSYHPADQIVSIMERVYHYGMTTTSGGNISIMDENGDLWITPGGIDKGSLTRNDIVRVQPDGTVIGHHKPSVELPFHQLIYQKRPDLRAVLHAHPPSLIAFSIVRRVPNTRLIPNSNIVCGDVGMASYALPGSPELGEKIATVFAQGCNAVMLENHGVVVGGKSLSKAFMIFETLDFSARLEINANRIGNPVALSTRYLDIYKHKLNVQMEEFIKVYADDEEGEARSKMCQLIQRAYEQRLFTSMQGTLSQRLKDNSFIITPYGMDRKQMDVEDLVLIDNGKKETGKLPSHSVLLHQHIYESNPDIHSVIIAHPPNIMAFAVTEEKFDSRLIPESYIVLRDTLRIPFGSNFMQPQLSAELFEKNTPVVIIENDCVIVTGKSLINAFDRLEVLEYSAKALIASQSLGKMVAIEEDEIKKIEKAFNL